MTKPLCKHCTAEGTRSKGKHVPVWFCDDHYPVRQLNEKGWPVTGFVSKANAKKTPKAPKAS